MMMMMMMMTKFVEKIKTRILYSIMFLFQLCCLRDNMKKYCWARLATDDNMADAHCMLDN